jgi:hypothetical protein
MTSDIVSPVDLGLFPPQSSGAFDRSSLRLRSDEPQIGQLRITVYGNVTTSQAFMLYNTYSLPQEGGPAAPVPPPFGKWRSFETTPTSFNLNYRDRIPDVPPQLLVRNADGWLAHGSGSA